MEDDDSDDESNNDLVPDEQLGAQSERDDYGPPHLYTIVLPVETRPIEELRDGARRTSSRKRTRPQSYINESYSEGVTTWEENGKVVRGINIIEQINAHMQTDDNDNEARIVLIYYPYPRMMKTMRTHPPGMHLKHRTRNSSNKLGMGPDKMYRYTRTSLGRRR
jgi:hypothetical protein